MNSQFITFLFRPLSMAFFLLLHVSIISACQADTRTGENQYLTAITINGIDITLETVDEKCALHVAGDRHPVLLSIPAPCGFVRASEKMQVQTYYYEDVGHILIIAGPPADISAYTSDSGVEPKHLCSDYGQAVLLKGKQVTLRDPQTSPLAFCHQLGFDEKVYFGYAYPVD